MVVVGIGVDATSSACAGIATPRARVRTASGTYAVRRRRDDNVTISGVIVIMQ
jgi:hypothetical protein